MEKYHLKNFMEDVVWQNVDDVIRGRYGACGCEKCRLDVAALALNYLPPHYVVTEKGELYSKINSLEAQYKLDVIQAIVRGIEKVAKFPCHEREKNVNGW